MLFLFSIFMSITFLNSDLSAKTLSLFNVDQKVEIDEPTYVKSGTTIDLKLLSQNYLFKNLSPNSRLYPEEFAECASNFIGKSGSLANKNKMISIEVATLACDKYYNPTTKQIDSPLVMVNAETQRNVILFRDAPPSQYQNSLRTRAITPAVPILSSPVATPAANPTPCSVSTQFKGEHCKTALVCEDPSCNPCFKESKKQGRDLIPSENIGNRIGLAEYFEFDPSENLSHLNLLLENNLIPKQDIVQNKPAVCIPCPPNSVRDSVNYCKYTNNNCDPFLQDYDSTKKQCKPKFCPAPNSEVGQKCLISCDDCNDGVTAIEKKIKALEDLQSRITLADIDYFTKILPYIFTSAFVTTGDAVWEFHNPEKFGIYKSTLLSNLKTLLNTFKSNSERCEKNTNRFNYIISCLEPTFTINQFFNEAAEVTARKDRCPKNEYFNSFLSPGKCEPAICRACQTPTFFYVDAENLLRMIINARYVSTGCDFNLFQEATNFLTKERNDEIILMYNKCVENKDSTRCKHLPQVTANHVYEYLKTNYQLNCLASPTSRGRGAG